MLKSLFIELLAPNEPFFFLFVKIQLANCKNITKP